MLTGDNGLITKANEAKIENALGGVKEAIKLEQGEKKIEDINLTPEVLLSEGRVGRTVQLKDDGNYYMYYALKENAYSQMGELGKGNRASLKDVFLIDDKFNVKYIDKNGKEYGDEIEEKILTDETEVRFANKGFSEYVSNISGVKEEDMQFQWMKNQTSLTITDTSVTSLEDLVFFPNLESLTLGDSTGKNSPAITSMDGVENCTKLSKLIIKYGPDKDYSAVSKLNNLTEFYKYSGTDYDNIVNELKLCKNLKSLTLSNMNINDMSKLESLNNLNYLSLSNNNINKIEGLDNMLNLQQLYLSSNKISKIEGIEKLTNLQVLYLSNNQISDITPISCNTSLTTLNLLRNTQIDGNRNNYTGERLEALNKIGEILDRGGTINLDVDKLGLFTNYKILDLTNQNLENLEVLEGLTELKQLTLVNNKLTLEDEKSQEILKSMTDLENLNLANNKITNIKEVNNFKKLKILYLQGENNNINLAEIEDIISNLDLLTVSTQSLKTILNCDTNKITKLRLASSSSLREIPDLSIFKNLKDLSLSNDVNIGNLEVISNISSLEILNLNNTNLHGRMIDFSKLTNLTNLDLSSNTLWDEDLENLKALKNNKNLTIYLSNNSLINPTALLELDPSTKIILTGNVNLTEEAKIKLKERFGSNVTF